MCGVCGIWSERLDPNDRAAIVRTISDAQTHRGPDDSGELTVGDVTLGMRRLSIIDLEGGQQPMYNETRDVGLVFNGAIYNYRELRCELAAKRHVFATLSDTEVIVHAYEEWGDECVSRLRGMFAFAILDWRRPEARKHGRDVPGPRLFLARDRLGIKPLYWHRANGHFLFASEVRAMLASGVVSRRLSDDGLASYLAFGSVQEPLTLVDGVYSLPPGHRMEVTDRGQRIEEYWDLPQLRAGPDTGDRQSFARATVAVREALDDAIRIHMRSDVPFGAFLSSGIDSSAVVALMAANSDIPVRTFTIAFEEAEFSEAELARSTALQYRTDHTQILLRPAEVLADLPRAIASMDQPSIDGVNTFYVSRAAKRSGVTVALSGLGGDEIFAGYPSFRSTPRLAAAARLVPGFARRALGRVPVGSSDRALKLRTALSGQGYFEHPYFTVRALFTPRQQAALLPSGSNPNAVDPWTRRVMTQLEKARGYDPINAVSYLECKNYLASTLLRDTDAMSMAHSLEVRVPLLDHVVVERVFELEGRLKLDAKIPKPLLVAATSDLLLPGVVNQRKRTFTFPWQTWLRQELRQSTESRLRDRSSAGSQIFNGEAAARVWEHFLRGETSWSRPWSLYVLGAWADLHLT